MSAKNVSKAFGSFRAVAGADLAVDRRRDHRPHRPERRRQIDLLQLPRRRDRADDGRIVFDGIDVTHAPPEAHARLGIGRTFQVPDHVRGHERSCDNVMVGAFLRHPHRNDARDQALRIVELTGLARRSAARGARHAGTQAPRNRPRAGDRAAAPAARRGARRTDAERDCSDAIALVRRIHDMGITIVIVEHIMEVIMTLTKRVLVFNQGHVIASGTPRDAVVGTTR